MLEASFRHALSRTDAGRLVREHLPDEAPALVLSVGKAAVPMVEEAVRAYPATPWLATPPAGGEAYPPSSSVGRVMPGSHPLPSRGSVAAAEQALALAGSLTASDLMLVLVSGGGSALWAAPWHESAAPDGVGVGLAEKRAATTALQRAGADIHELNTVRRHLSRIKGGRLAAATAASVLTLALSDVPGDALEDIASGPTVPDPTTFADALEVLDRYEARLEPTGLEPVRRHLARGAAGEVPETPKPGSAASARWATKVIGSAEKLLSAAADFFTREGYEPLILSDRLQGEAADMAGAHAALVSGLLAGRVDREALARLVDRGPAKPDALREAAARLEGWLGEGRKPLVLLSGGEATVTVKGQGRGGRNLEFAAWLLHYLADRADDGARSIGEQAVGSGIWALSAGSDGVDGSSPAAGAFVTPESGHRVAALGRPLAAYLAANDTDALFTDLGDRLITGPTGNNLNDYRALVVPPRSAEEYG